MKSLIWLYLKTFVFMAIGFGSFMMLLTLVFGGTVDFKEHLNSGIFFGFFMSAILVSLHAILLKAKGVKEINSESLSPIQKKTLTSSLSQEALASMLLSLPMIRKVQSVDSQILLETVPSLSSWGEKIFITAKPVQDGIFEYFITSKPLLKLTLVDYGKNFQNILKIEQLIKKE